MNSLKIIVGSENPVKIRAVEEGFKKVFSESNFNTEGFNANSNVSNQPIGSEETLLGALNRADNSKIAFPKADFWVGIEGGNIIHGKEMEAMAWVVIRSKNKTGKARTAGFFLSPKTVELINQGYELGKADERLFGVNNSKEKMGSSGLLTENLIPRLDLYIPAVIFALIPFKNPELYYDEV